MTATSLRLVARWGGHPGLYGFMLEASYKVPVKDQQTIYDAFKKAAPRPDLVRWQSST